MRLILSRALIVLAAMALPFGGPAFAQALIVRATGPSAGAYPIGQTIAAKEITLAQGDQITAVIGGVVRTLTGPGRINLAATTPTSRSVVGVLVGLRKDRIDRLSVARAAGGGIAPGGLYAPSIQSARPPLIPMPPPGVKPNTLWLVDIHRGGAVCLPEAATNVYLWASEGAPPSGLTFSRMADGITAHTDWADGKLREGVAVGSFGVPVDTLASWPAELTPRPGDVFEITDGYRVDTKVTFKRIVGGGTAETLAAALISAGCDVQLDLLLASLPKR